MSGYIGPSVLESPPAKSRLARYLHEIESTLALAGPLHESEDAETALAGRLICVGLQPLHEIPSEFAKHDVVMPVLHRLGMPIGLEGVWLDELVDRETEALREASALQAQQMKVAKKGRPSQTNSVTALLMLAAYRDAAPPGKRFLRNARCQNGGATSRSGPPAGSRPSREDEDPAALSRDERRRCRDCSSLRRTR